MTWSLAALVRASDHDWQGTIKTQRMQSQPQPQCLLPRGVVAIAVVVVVVVAVVAAVVVVMEYRHWLHQLPAPPGQLQQTVGAHSFYHPKHLAECPPLLPISVRSHRINPHEFGQLDNRPTAVHRAFTYCSLYPAPVLTAHNRIRSIIIVSPDLPYSRALSEV